MAAAAELISADEAKKRAEARDQKETGDTPAPGEAALFHGELGVAAAGTAVDTGHIVDRLLVGNIHRRYRCLDRLRGGRACEALTTDGAEITGGVAAAAVTTDTGRPVRQLAAAVGADAACRVGGDFHTTVRTTHDHSSFLLIIGEANKKCKKKQI